MLAFKPEFNYVNYSYEQMRQDLLSIVDTINGDLWKPDVILGITRGGLIPAVMLSHHFNVMMIPINLSFRDFKSDLTRVDDEINHSVNLNPSKFKNILVVDDILDSGETLKQLKDIFNVYPKFEDFDIRCATLFYNVTNEAGLTPEYYAQKIDKSVKNDWITFPAESWWKS